MDYTISSTDYEHNNRIYTNITAPQTEFCRMTITSLTTMANFVVLDKNDYIVINDIKYTINDDFSDVTTVSLVEYLNTIMHENSNISIYYDQCSRIYFISEQQPIIIKECTYNLKLLLGLVNVSLPLYSNDQNVILCPDVGLFMSTPVLYLACNLGSNSYKNTSKDNFTSMRILMRLTNSFFAKQPIVNVNGDYTTTVKCSDLSDIRFTLIDANYHEVKLLSPMYLTVQIEAVPDAEDKQFNAVPNIQTQLNMSEYAYLRDLTERGQEYNIEEIGNYIYLNEPNDQQQTQQIEPQNNEKTQSEQPSEQ